MRLEKIKFFPLKIGEFVPVLAKNLYFYKTDFDADYVNMLLYFQEALYKLCGLKAIHDFLKSNKEENEKAAKKKK